MTEAPFDPPGRPNDSALGRILAEPMLHFLALAALIFLAYAALSPPAPPPQDTIIITAQDITALKAKFHATWGRDPTDDELRTSVDQQIRSEVLYREALAMGLDQGDQVVRARMAQKIEFLLSDPANLNLPTEADLRAYYDANAQNYAVPDRVSFDQVFLGTPAPGAVEAALTALQAGQSSDGFGIASLLPASLASAQAAAVDSAFGEGFFQRLLTEPIGSWAGPVTSAYGQHLIRITALTASTVPPYDAVRTEVAADWRREAARKAGAAAYDRLKAQYRIDLSATGLSP